MRRRSRTVAAVCILAGLLTANAASAAEVTCNVLKDGGVSTYSSERNDNRGQRSQTRVKTYQEFYIGSFDLSAISGWTVTEAELHVHMASNDLFVADVATIAVPWDEGSGTGGDAAVGECCYDWVHHPADVNNPAPTDWWAYPGSRFGDVTWGNSYTITSYAHNDEITQQADSWRTIMISPDIVHGMALDQDGLCLSDSSQLATNNDVHCREQSASKPYLVVRGGVTDVTDPSAVTGLTASTDGLWNGEVLLSWTAGGDDGASGKAFGYDIRYSTSPLTEGNFSSASPFPRYDIPRPFDSGQSQQAWFEGLTAGMTYYIGVEAYDEAGNRSALVSTSVVMPAAQPTEQLADAGWSPFSPAASIVDIEGKLRVWACEDLVKVNPVTGNRKEDGYTGSGADGYKKGNSVWDAVNAKTYLTAARNEVVSFQLYLERLVSSLSNVTVTVSDLTGPGGTITASPNITLSRLWYAPQTAGSPTYWATCCLPFGAFFGTSFNIPTSDNGVTGQTNQGVWVDVYVPTGTTAGTYVGTITIDADELSGPAQGPLELLVRNFALPDTLSFVVDLNSYGNLPDNGASQADSELWHHQLAHFHKQTVNNLGYSHSGNTTWPYAPPVSGTGLGATVSDWSAYDAQVGRYLDGTAFSAGMGYNGPGMNTPTSHLYVVAFEDYPLDLETYYQPSGQFDLFDSDRTLFTQTFWEPDDATPATYDDTMKAIVKEYAEHFQAQGYTQTHFQFYLNNKYSWTNHAGLWNLDEPTNYLDFAALEYFFDLFHAGVDMAAATDVKWHYRTDISTRYCQHKGVHDYRFDMMCASQSVWDDSGELVKRRKRAYGEEAWWYGTGPSETGWMVDLPARFVQRWSQGAVGGLPYWATDYAGGKDVVDDGNPDTYDNLCIFVRGGQWGYDHPLASIRMKVMKHAQQTIEYLHALAEQPGWDRNAATRALSQGYADSAGGETFWALDADDYYELREDLAASIAAANIPGDFDHDGDVDLDDYTFFAGEMTGPGATVSSEADLDGDGDVDLDDFAIFMANFTG